MHESWNDRRDDRRRCREWTEPVLRGVHGSAVESVLGRAGVVGFLFAIASCWTGCAKEHREADRAKRSKAAPTGGEARIVRSVDAGGPGAHIADVPVGGPGAPAGSRSARPVVDWTNQQPVGRDDPKLMSLGRALLQAVSTGQVRSVDAFFFPFEPFLRLKQARNPSGYWKFLHRVFLRDLQSLHRRRRAWQGATFDGWRLDRPVWVRPGREHNYIGYFRLRHARLFFRQAGRRHVLVVDTMISWQGHWTVVHLRPNVGGRLRSR
ncbi:MAG: hypothetical protein J7M25_11135 [Deltaproteobacteria bacterium]|nr:hypothetical protein [Deltaproteobacteria bacterium]